MEHNIPWQIFLFFTFYVFNDLITIRTTTTTTIKGRLAVGISKAEANRSVVEMKQKPVTLAGLLCGTASQFTGQPRCTRKFRGAARAQSHDTMITLLLAVKLQLFDARQLPARLLSRSIILLIFFIFAFSDPFYLLQVLLQLLFNPLYKKIYWKCCQRGGWRTQTTLNSVKNWYYKEHRAQVMYLARLKQQQRQVDRQTN